MGKYSTARSCLAVFLAIGMTIFSGASAQSQSATWEFSDRNDPQFTGLMDCAAYVEGGPENSLIIYFSASRSGAEFARLSFGTADLFDASARENVDAIDMVFDAGDQKMVFTVSARHDEIWLPYPSKRTEELMELIASSHSLALRLYFYDYTGPEPMLDYQGNSGKFVPNHNDQISKVAMEIPLKGSRRAVTSLVQCIAKHSSASQRCERPELSGLVSEGLTADNGLKWTGNDMANPIDQNIQSLARSIKTLEDYFGQWKHDYSSCIRHQPQEKCAKADRLRKELRHDIALLERFYRLGRAYDRCVGSN